MDRATGLSRREFIQVSVAGAALLGHFGLSAHAQQLVEIKEDKGIPFQLGIQSYSLRELSLDEVIQNTPALGIHCVEFYPAHLPMDLPPEKSAAIKHKLADAGIKLPSYGVVGFGADEAENRKAFEFAAGFGIKTLTADPSPESFSSLEGLVKEFDVQVAIHNHGPGSRYSTLDDVLTAVKDRDARIGACVDTGHFLRSREEPPKAIRRLGDRVHAVHLKDIRSYEDHTNVVNGRGLLDLRATLEALRETGFKGHMAIEYEAERDNPQPAIIECVAEVMKVVREW